MNPHIVDFVSDATSLGKSVAIVTNAQLLEKNLSRDLLAAGLKSITFSIDAPDQFLADKLRFGTDFSAMEENMRTFMECAADNPSVMVSVFCALSVRNIGHFEKIIDLAAKLKVRALMATDINFEQNLSESLRENNTVMYKKMLRAAISRAFSLGLPVLSIRGLEQFGLEARHYRYLLRPSEIFNREPRHQNCRSPWQCVPVNTEGGVAVCDCQPDKIIGNILNTPLDEIWNNGMMMAHRERMTGNDPPSACRACPRY
jgi:radical SAM protein with 4Fe4S-binding SPASM domain